MRLKLQGDPKVLHWIEADKLETVDSSSVKLHLASSASAACKRTREHRLSPHSALPRDIATSRSHLFSPLEPSLSCPLILQPRKGLAGGVDVMQPPPELLPLPQEQLETEVCFLDSSRVSCQFGRWQGFRKRMILPPRGLEFLFLCTWQHSTAPVAGKRMDLVLSGEGSIIINPCSARSPAGGSARSTRPV